MSVRAKFFIDSIVERKDSRTINAQPVMSGEKDNKEWSKWTPSGSLVMQITNPDAYNQFEVGKKYYIDFTPVPDGE